MATSIAKNLGFLFEPTFFYNPPSSCAHQTNMELKQLLSFQCLFSIAQDYSVCQILRIHSCISFRSVNFQYLQPRALFLFNNYYSHIILNCFRQHKILHFPFLRTIQQIIILIISNVTSYFMARIFKQHHPIRLLYKVKVKC